MTHHPLIQKLNDLSKPGVLYEKLPDDAVRCHACAHQCLIKPGRRGICQMRFNQDGVLSVPWGYVAGIQPDPIEKKPFYHFLPGSQTLTFGMLGCNFHCSFCQNWHSSQTLQDDSADRSIQYIEEVKPEQLIAYAKRNGVKVIASSYNEPLITTEWAVDIFRLAKEQEIKTVFVSNGFATPQVLEYLHPYLDGFKVDLKAMQDETYRDLGGRLQPVLDSIKLAKEMGFWVEVVTLVIPGMNDKPDDLWNSARYLQSVSADIPWHVTAFHPDYKMPSGERTSAKNLLQAADIAQEAGLHYVYAGNLPGRVGSLEDTFCPQCSQNLIRRSGFTVLENRITAEGNCPQCGTKIAGVWA
ncbi:MAG: AmmeMemoRadiSam system radical SAM enzyme [Chloroflexi bacterium]|nr:AmmeMemoRadiSam system radical SAM enzyme [Chloroflexota bacterium]